MGMKRLILVLPVFLMFACCKKVTISCPEIEKFERPVLYEVEVNDGECLPFDDVIKLYKNEQRLMSTIKKYETQIDIINKKTQP
jgi:hypothetical protein